MELRLAFEVCYEWHKLDSKGNAIGPADTSVILCDTLDEAVKEYKIWLDSIINEVKSHQPYARMREAGSCWVHAIYVNEDNEFMQDAWFELTDEQKNIVNSCSTSFYGRDLEVD